MVSFEDARMVFNDDFAVEFYDDEHSEWEDRFLLLGLSAQLRLPRRRGPGSPSELDLRRAWT